MVDLLERSEITCGCGHVSGLHAHSRPGTDCAQCDCARFRRSWRELVRGTRQALSA
jgi:hypothetical protein